MWLTYCRKWALSSALRGRSETQQRTTQYYKFQKYSIILIKSVYNEWSKKVLHMIAFNNLPKKYSNANFTFHEFHKGIIFQSSPNISQVSSNNWTVLHLVLITPKIGCYEVAIRLMFCKWGRTGQCAWNTFENITLETLEMTNYPKFIWTYCIWSWWGITNC